jgi:hypothetical protein
MDRATRNKFVSGTDQQQLTSGTACWETAPLVFAKLDADFGPFDLDLTADADRHLWYSNPPYGPFIQRLLPKALDEARQGFTSVLLLPLRVTKAFKRFILRGASDLIFPDKRLVFFEDGVPRINEKAWREKGELRADPALFDSVLVRYAPGTPEDASPRLSIWTVPPHVTRDDLDRARARRIEWTA